MIYHNSRSARLFDGTNAHVQYHDLGVSRRGRFATWEGKAAADYTCSYDRQDLFCRPLSTPFFACHFSALMKTYAT